MKTSKGFQILLKAFVSLFLLLMSGIAQSEELKGTFYSEFGFDRYSLEFVDTNKLRLEFTQDAFGDFSYDGVYWVACDNKIGVFIPYSKENTYFDHIERKFSRFSMCPMAGRIHKYYIINWGQRCYLLEEWQLLNFCNDVNVGCEPRKSTYGLGLLREGDHLLPVDNLPEMPMKYLRYLLPEPVSGKVMSFDAESKTGTVSLGREEGLLPGMLLYVLDQDKSLVAEIEVKEVLSESNSRVECIWINRKDTKLYVNDIVVSRGPEYQKLDRRLKVGH